ncbi:hypothetical protein CU097_014547 [Rhizopus azygosporus]|uniref:Uncharacterized protein n=1 Tax=Rhizopus azygosporus TaxID=86630 RepID=A0A367KAJ4_RHIAZ|nr:hypothetical protein CU097_014547 [Rhizopus azygosporus]
MEKHERIIKNLNEQFRQVDKAYENNDMRVFGKNTTRIFQELDVIRRKQIDLASDHVALEAMNDIPLIKMNHKTDQNNKVYTESFEKKKDMLKNMMKKLDELTQAMEQFKNISKPDYQGNDSLQSFQHQKAAF